MKEFEHDCVATTIKACFINNLGYRSKRSEQDLVTDTIKAWFMHACPILVNDLAYKQIFNQERKLVEREDMN